MPLFRSLPVDYQAQATAWTYEILETAAGGTFGNPVTSQRRDASLENWLSSLSNSRSTASPLRATLRLVHAHLNLVKGRRFSVSLTEPLCRRICCDLALPTEFVDRMGEISDRIWQSSSTSAGTGPASTSYIVNYRADSEDTGCATLLFTHKPATRATTGFLLTTQHVTHTEVASVLAQIKNFTPVPTILFTALADLQIARAAVITHFVDEKLGEFELKVGPNLTTRGTDWMNTNSGSATASLDNVRFLLGRNGRRLANLAILMDECRLQLASTGDTSAVQAARIHIGNQCRDSQHLRNQAENAEIRVRTQREAAIQSIARGEAAATLTIARSTMRDGAAMKALALLTTVFLPGTYLATMFSMPIVDWKSAHGLPGGAFGLYWIVTALLTAVVLGIWALWMWRERDRKSLRKTA